MKSSHGKRMNARPMVTSEDVVAETTIDDFVTLAKVIIGTNIRDVRKEKGWTQEVLARRAKLSRSYINALERGKGNPTVDALALIANALKIPITQLLRGVN